MNRRGSILIISLWILALLAVFAVCLGARASASLKLARYQRDKLRAECLAKAGINQAIAELEKDKNNDYDSLSEPWSTGRNQQGNPIFENVEIKSGSGQTFTVKYLYDKDKDSYLCMQDEERKININGIETEYKEQVLARLFEFAEVQKTKELIDLLAKWIDDTLDAEDKEKIFKNSKLKSPEELLVILGYFYREQGENEPDVRAQETYNKVKDSITTYGDGRININTISRRNLEILFNAALDQMRHQGMSSLPTEAEAQELLNLFFTFREQNLSFENVGEIKPKLASLGLQATDNKSKIIEILIGEGIILAASNNFRIESSGNVNHIVKKINAVYNRQNKKIVYWHEN